MQIRIDGHDLPGRACGPSPERPDGHRDIHVGVPRRGRPDELLGLTPADAPSVSWTLDCTVVDRPGRPDLRGPHIHGSPAARFLYLSWGTVSDGVFSMFRRAKLHLTDVPDDVLDAGCRSGLLVARVGLTDQRGNPVCASLGGVQWSAA